ncbi:hypothetical protein X739_20560 [Mesorhizobium sp. LNHC220B00]|uniref:hypothetical protein n=1 Tax=Mesorhizobium sp. LNHC229A00 TaxID=1287240 RepID=UPI0003CDECB2|nr:MULTISPECIES: hypothetical protein [unclassified Mesorhizobium]ESY84682.1 hypothetical protein X739_20560 [Mesorhizobium sp. LNHC220B00]ESY96728.1 hypothetical protein X741_07675 [Mesorhizobium sp. LNHC229A00]
MNWEAIQRRDHVRTYPSREAALALIDWLQADDWEAVSDLDKRLAGVGIDWTRDFQIAAERCFMVYGYPALEAVTVARKVAEVSMRPSKPHAGTAGGSGDLSPPSTPAAPSARPQGSYGFTRRET